VLDRAVGALLVVEEDEVAVGQHLAVRLDQDGAGVEVEVDARGGARVPAETDQHGGHARCLLGEGDVAALAQADRHEVSSRSRTGTVRRPVRCPPRYDGARTV
jgi:hypothetical protein